MGKGEGRVEGGQSEERCEKEQLFGLGSRGGGRLRFGSEKELAERERKHTNIQ